MFFYFYIFFASSAYYYKMLGSVSWYRCSNRDELIDKINFFDLDVSALPSIMIDEDLDMDCNELPNTRISIKSRKSSYPVYTISSNATNVSFTLDTTTDAEDNCPGFLFENIRVILRGSNMNTTNIEFGKNVSISTENKDFSLNVVIAKMSYKHLVNIKKISFTRLTLKEDDEPNNDGILASNDGFSNNLNNTKYQKNLVNNNINNKLKFFGDISECNHWTEANMFDISLSSNTEAIFADNKLTLSIEGYLNDLVVKLPNCFNYSNAFYFHLCKSGIYFGVSGNLNYSAQFPHFFFIDQKDYSCDNVIVNISRGNFLNAKGRFYEDISGSLFSFTLINSIFYFDNDNEIDTLYLYDVSFYPLVPIVMNFFYFSGTKKVQEDLILTCKSVKVEINSETDSILEPIEGKILNITTESITEFCTIIGDVYVTKLIEVKSGEFFITIKNLHLVNNPKIRAISAWGDNSDYRIKILESVSGEAVIVPIASSKDAIDYMHYICGMNDDVHLNADNYVVDNTTVPDIRFEVVIVNNCISTNQIDEYPVTSITVCFDGERKCSTTYERIMPKDDDDWTIFYKPSITSITFLVMRDTTIDLSVIQNPLTKITIQPTYAIFQPTTLYKVRIKASQSAADNIISWIFGSSSLALDVEFTKFFIIKGEMVLYQTIKYDLNNFKEKVDFTELSKLRVNHVSQLNDLKSIIDDIHCVIVEHKNILYSINFIGTGWNFTEKTAFHLVEGISHNNITIKVSKTDSSRRLKVNCATNSPYQLYIAFAYTSFFLDVVELAGDWSNFYYNPIFFQGYLILEIPFEKIPICFDDRITSYVVSGNANIMINRTLRSSILTVDSSIYITRKFAFGNSDTKKELYIEFLNEVEGMRKIEIENKGGIVYFKFMNQMLVDYPLSRFWRESNGINMIGEGSITKPAFLDTISAVWQYNRLHFFPPAVYHANELIKAKYHIQDSPNVNMSDQTYGLINHFFQVMTATMEISFEELREKIEFEANKLDMKFANRTLKFEIFIDYIFMFEPDIFVSNGLKEAENAKMIGLYLKRVENDISSEERKNTETKSMNIGLIAGIAMGATAGSVAIALIVVVFVKKQKAQIDNILSG